LKFLQQEQEQQKAEIEDVVSQIRLRFPTIEKSENDGKERIFFDNGAGSLVLGSAIQAEEIARTRSAPNRGGYYSESKVNEEFILEGRKAVADLLNAPNPYTIVQGDSASDLFFKLAYGLSAKLEPSDNVVSTSLEHYANITPYLDLQKKGRIKEVRLARLKMDEGTLDVDHLANLVDNRTKVVAISASSNLLGTKTPVKEIAKIAHNVGAYLVVDGVHHVPQGPVDVQDLDCDFLVFSGYKFFAPHGSYMYVKEQVFPEIQTFHVDPNATGKVSPSSFELGTRDPGKFAAIRAVIDYHLWIYSRIRGGKDSFDIEMQRSKALRETMSLVEDYGRELTRALLYGDEDNAGLLNIPNVKLYGITDKSRFSERDCTVTFKLKNMNDTQVIEKLWTDYRITSRGGHFWNNAQDVYSIPSAVRVTLLHYNTKGEISRFLRAVKKLASQT
jgi:selenocysteine lyase/cysteine desulfurase